MVFDQIFILLLAGFGFVGGLTLLSCSAYAVKRSQKEHEITEMKEKLLAEIEARRSGKTVTEVGSEAPPIEVS